jgi:2,3-dihydroxyphenylpropionate 1,2-dioxygenase
MAELIGMVGLSHSPFWEWEQPVSGPGAAFVAKVTEARGRCAQAAPDAIVIFGPDHFRNFFYDSLPPFCIGTERCHGFGDYGTPKGELPLARALARGILEHLMGAGFDPAQSADMGVDHGLTQSYAVLTPSPAVPLVPIMVNAGGAPLPSMRRCHAFGRAVGDAIRASDAVARVLVVGSGGMSHWPKSMSLDNPALDERTRDYAIHGRKCALEDSAARVASVIARRGQVRGRVNPEFDQWVIGRLRANQIEALLDMPSDELERKGGNGAHELRCWVAAIGAWDGVVQQFGYEPVPEWVTGMGCVAAWQ